MSKRQSFANNAKQQNGDGGELATPSIFVDMEKLANFIQFCKEHSGPHFSSNGKFFTTAEIEQLAKITKKKLTVQKDIERLKSQLADLKEIKEQRSATFDKFGDVIDEDIAPCFTPGQEQLLSAISEIEKTLEEIGGK